MSIIALIIDAAYALMWVYTSRWLYGRWYCSRPGRTSGEYVVINPRSERPAVRPLTAVNEQWSLGMLTFASMVFALAWPLVWLVALVRFRPPADAAAAEAKLQNRIAELEREAEIQP